ncbi:MAG: chlorohydrolase, partial [Peptoniphilus sp.]|nr:chlorohydrolase [Peptoniphilus sp.]
CDPTVGFMETINMQFKNNPIILSKYFNRPLGVIEKGAYADLITLKYDPLTPLNENSWYGHSLFGFNGGIVQDNMINGKFVMKDREILNVDTAEVMAKSRERAAKIWPQM